MRGHSQSLSVVKWHASIHQPLWVAPSLIPVVVLWSLGNTAPVLETRDLVRHSILWV